MPSRAYTSLLLTKTGNMYLWYILGVNALTGLYLIATRSNQSSSWQQLPVSMPSRAYTSLLRS